MNSTGTMASPFDRLSDDVMLVFFEHILSGDRHLLKACSAVCRRFYCLAVPILYRRVDFSDEKETNNPTRLARFACEGSLVPTLVRSVSINVREMSVSSETHPFVAFLKRATNLKEIQLYTNCRLPRTLLYYIHTFSTNAVIHIDAILSRTECEEDFELEEFPGGTNNVSWPQLRSFVVSCRLSDIEERGPSDEYIIDTLTCAPYLRQVTFREDVDIEGGLELETIPNCSLEVLEYPLFSKDAMKDWAKESVWQNLKVLKVDLIECLEPLSGNVPALRHLTIYTSDFIIFETLDGLIFSACLETIVLEDVVEDEIPFIFLSQYKDTLLSLSIGITDDTTSSNTKLVSETAVVEARYISVASIRRLNGICPKLNRLCVWLLFTDQSRWSYVMEFAQFMHLRELMLVAETEHVVDVTHDSWNLNLPLSTCKDLLNDISRFKVGSRIVFAGVARPARAVDFDSARERACLSAFQNYDGTISTRTSHEVGGARRDLFVRGYASSLEDEAMATRLSMQPFSSNFPKASAPADLLWWAKQLESPNWKVENLLPKQFFPSGLLQIVEFKTPSNAKVLKELRKVLEKGEQAKAASRRIVEEEMKYWNMRWNFEAKHGSNRFLYDILREQGMLEPVPVAKRVLEPNVQEAVRTLKLALQQLGSV